MLNKTCLYCKHAIDKNERKLSHGLHKPCFIDCFQLDEWSDFEGVEKKQAASSEPKDPKERAKYNSHDSFFHGKFRKYAATLGGRNYILKVKEDSSPELPDVEYVCNELARELKLPIPWFGLIDFYTERTFVTRNFVSEEKDAANLVHIYHYLKERRYDCENLLDIIATETNRFRDQEIFIYMCLFDSLIGNHDRHGRNLGFLYTSRGANLAPIYDNPSMLGTETGSILKAFFEPRGRIYTNATEEPLMADYVIEFVRLGQRPSVERFSKKIKIKSLDKIIQQSTCTILMKEALIEIINRRYQELKHALV